MARNKLTQILTAAERIARYLRENQAKVALKLKFSSSLTHRSAGVRLAGVVYSEDSIDLASA